MSVSGNLVSSSKNLLNGTYVTTSDLSSYVTSSTLSSTLSSYVTTSTLTSRLSSYVTSSTYSSDIDYLYDFVNFQTYSSTSASTNTSGWSSSDPFVLNYLRSYVYLGGVTVTSYTGCLFYWQNNTGGQGMFCRVHKLGAASSSGWTSYTPSSYSSYLRYCYAQSLCYYDWSTTSGSFRIYPPGVLADVTGVGSTGMIAGTLYYPTTFSVLLEFIVYNEYFSSSTTNYEALSASTENVVIDEDGNVYRDGAATASGRASE